MNIGMLIWLVVRLLMECVCESRENAAAAANANESGQITRIMSNLQMSMQRWKDGRVSVETLQARIRRRTIDANKDRNNMSCENPAVHIEMVERSGEVKVENEENAENEDVDTTAISILDNAAVPPTTMHINPHWKRLKRSVKAANTFKSSAGQQKRVKRLSKVMKAQRDSSAVEENTTAAAEGAEIKKVDSNI